MTEPAIWQRCVGMLKPVNQPAMRAFLNMKDESFITMGPAEKVRSPEQLARYWATLGRVWDSLPETWQRNLRDKDGLHARTKCALGYCQTREGKDGTVIQIPDSVGLGNMPHEKFNELMDKAIALWSETLGTAVEDLRSE